MGPQCYCLDTIGGKIANPMHVTRFQCGKTLVFLPHRSCVSPTACLGDEVAQKSSGSAFIRMLPSEELPQRDPKRIDLEA